MKTPHLLAAGILLLGACQHPHAPELPTANAAPAASVKTVAEDPKALKITRRCAVFYAPDEHKLAKLKKENGEEAFYTIADDNQHYLSDSRQFLADKGIEIVDATNGALSFRPTGGKPQQLNLDEEQYNWGVLIFDGKSVHKADITNIEGEYEKYLK
ncbi:hypothetical protein [Chitinophaga vietnamensis]|uniref:hypothetical protein n=1 Tax=Chitinophaga vietnamensis TaxID=2593957 RepID=UPI0011A6C6BD|nr:hypothetical protein [Chitinophaga vietnamensis]